ncbi:hypothetical protein TRIATDRAFT_299013 [Trichoderma atroviride IMI 206040]|uniref:Methyltransferase n=1 Tax=Hypocrea atroviridis (strain ATCC 20476 / IMI 206040) TaxID=452589 RepID=G9NS99_HYPAI|nr:uncharacterized protein TRIATDRAFT_299013 [Trichoderma atroviride IMI 206040]EHK46301.1 hypothetical protein TRIATDRAFT_299013 [Trichoderma atroviride IMI 206040]
MAVISTVPRGDVTANLNFFTAPADGAVPFNLVGDGHSPELARRNYGDDFHDVVIHDVRGRESDFNVNRDAFELVQGIPPSAETEFVDDDSIKNKYYPEVERLLLDKIPGADKIYIFDHTIRRSDPNASRAPVLRVHIDQTAASTEKRVRRYFPDEADELLKRRYRIVNVWRSLNKGPIEASPLALAASATLDEKDVTPISHRYADGYHGETAAVNYNPDQKFYYFSGMTPDERLLIECFDSDSLKAGSKTGGRTPHTAFVDPRTRPDAEGRESIEVRALVFGN